MNQITRDEFALTHGAPTYVAVAAAAAAAAAAAVAAAYAHNGRVFTRQRAHLPPTLDKTVEEKGEEKAVTI